MCCNNSNNSDNNNNNNNNNNDDDQVSNKNKDNSNNNDNKEGEMGSSLEHSCVYDTSSGTYLNILVGEAVGVTNVLNITFMTFTL